MFFFLLQRLDPPVLPYVNQKVLNLLALLVQKYKY